VTWLLVKGLPLLLQRTTQMDSSSSSRRYVHSCWSAAGGCHTELSSSSRRRMLLKSTAAPGCTLAHTCANQAHACTAMWWGRAEPEAHGVAPPVVPSSCRTF
jgi:hypothetical protein